MALQNSDWYGYLQQHNLPQDTLQTPNLINAATEQAGSPLVGNDPSVGTFHDQWAHLGDSTYGFGASENNGGFGHFNASDLGHNTSWFGQNIAPFIIDAMGGFINPFVGAGVSALQSATRGGGLEGALTAGLTSLGGSLAGPYLSGAANAAPHSLLDFGIQGATNAGIGALGSSITGKDPLYGAGQGAVKGLFNAYGGLGQLGSDLGIAGGASNAMDGGSVGSAFGSLYPGSSNVAPSSGSFQGGSVPLMGTPSNSGSNDNYLSSLFSSSSPGTQNVNVSGTQSPSLFDQAGSFLSSPSNLLGLGIAGAGIAGAMDSGGGTTQSPSSSIGAGLSSFTPERQPGLAPPASLANYTNSALSPDQTLSGIATKGVYGGGNGPEEQKYFLNLINNRLVDQTGHVANDMSGINPIENSYLSQLGLGGYQNPNDLLRGISNYAA